MMEGTDDMLSAYLDGELPSDTRAALEALLAKDEALRARLEGLRRINAQLQAALPLQAADGDALLAARIRRGLAPRTPAVRAHRVFSRRQVTWFAAAASLFGVAMGHLLTRELTGAGRADWMTASGTLATALETLPSGGTARDGAQTARMVLSFKASDGRYCRAFSWQAGAKAAEGLACREAGGWQVVAMEASTAGDAGTAFRPASGAAATIDAAMDALGGSESLDAATEAALIAKAWRAP